MPAIPSQSTPRTGIANRSSHSCPLIPDKAFKSWQPSVKGSCCKQLQLVLGWHLLDIPDLNLSPVLIRKILRHVSHLCPRYTQETHHTGQTMQKRPGDSFCLRLQLTLRVSRMPSLNSWPYLPHLCLPFCSPTSSSLLQISLLDRRALHVSTCMTHIQQITQNHHLVFMSQRTIN